MRTAFAMGCVIVAGSLGCDELFENNAVADPRALPAIEGTDTDPRALTQFNDSLAGYGYWSDDDEYGTVWTPSDPTFVPYASNGRFVNIDGNVVWLSDLAWGPATLHHGRWVYHRARWHWVPGLKYSSAWVSWTRDGDTTLWAPAPPSLAWREGIAFRINPPEEPFVGSFREDVVAFVPSTPARAQTTVENDDFADRWLSPAWNGW